MQSHVCTMKKERKEEEEQEEEEAAGCPVAFINTLPKRLGRL